MLFKKLFGINLFSNQKSFSGLYDQYAVLGFEKQRLFAPKVEGLEWNINLEMEKINFGEKLSYPVQVIGSLTFSNKNWLWAWVNNNANIPNKLLTEVKELRAYGKKHKINELTQANTNLSINDVHSFGLVILGMTKSNGYYLGNFGEGTLLVTIRDINLDKQLLDINELHHQILTTFPEFISMFKIKAQQKVLKHYLVAKKYYIVEDTKTHLIGRREGREIIGIFDDKGQLLQLKG